MNKPTALAISIQYRVVKKKKKFGGGGGGGRIVRVNQPDMLVSFAVVVPAIPNLPRKKGIPGDSNTFILTTSHTVL